MAYSFASTADPLILCFRRRFLRNTKRKKSLIASPMLLSLVSSTLTLTSLCAFSVATLTTRSSTTGSVFQSPCYRHLFPARWRYLASWGKVHQHRVHQGRMGRCLSLNSLGCPIGYVRNDPWRYHLLQRHVLPSPRCHRCLHPLRHAWSHGCACLCFPFCWWQVPWRLPQACMFWSLERMD